MSKKVKDPYPITDVYHVTSSLIDAATVVVTDLCENLSNSIDTSDEDIVNSLKKINTKKYNSISVGNGADGIYPIWVGVDKNNKVRKVFVNVNKSNYDYDREKIRKLISWCYHKSDLNDQFFLSSKKKITRKKLFDMKIQSGAIAIADYKGNFQFEHHEHVTESLDDKYFKINNVYQNNYPIGLFIFKYGYKKLSESLSFKNSKIHDEKIVSISDYKTYKYVEFLSTLLDESCYPTKYIFEKYLVEGKDYQGKTEIKIIDEKISVSYLTNRLPKALEILKKQNQILFGKNYKEVHEIRKTQFENFIYGIIKDIEPQELNLPTYEKNVNNPKTESNKLFIETPGTPYIQDTFYDGYKLKSEPSLIESSTIPVKNGKYPCYIHTYQEKDEENDYELENVYVVIEGLEHCYLNRNAKGQLFFDKKYRESLLIKKYVENKSKKVSIDKICLRDSTTLKEVEKLHFIEELELHGFNSIKDWSGLSKLKKLKKLKLFACEVDFKTSYNFFKNLYSLNNLEELVIDDCSVIQSPNKLKFPKNIYLKKLKSYKIDFRSDWKNSEHKNFPGHKGYGNENVWFIVHDLLNIFQFPNFEKFKSLEKLSLYNFFRESEKEGSLFDHELNNEEDLLKINTLCKKSNIKDIWIYGYNFRKANELVGTKFSKLALGLSANLNIKINGLNNNTLQKIQVAPFSLSSRKINKLILVNNIDEMYGEKIIKQQDNTLALNYFAILLKKENEKLLDDAFNQPLDELEINNMFQFLRSDLEYGDTFDPLIKRLNKNRNIKKIILKLNENDGNEHHEAFKGTWDFWEINRLKGFILDLLINFQQLKVIVKHDSFQEVLKDNKKISIYLEILEMFRILDENPNTKNRFEIDNFTKSEITKTLDKYFLEVADTIVVIEDNVGWNDSNSVRDIEIINCHNFDRGDGAFEINLGLKKITVSREGERPFLKEGKFIYNIEGRLKSFANEKYFHFLNNRIEGINHEAIIFVKKKYLDKIKITLFKNIKHYFYFAEVDNSLDKKGIIQYKKFWKENDYFKFPSSVKFNKLETLNICGGRNIQLNNLLKDINCSQLKQLVIRDCIIEERNFPSLPNLENLVIKDTYSNNAKPFVGFSNLPNLKNLLLLNLYETRHDGGRWMTTEFDFKDLYKLSKLEYLRMELVNPVYLNYLSNLKNLQELELSFYLITEVDNADDGTINNILVDQDFKFLNQLNKLRKLKLTLPDYHSSVKGPLALSYVNKKLEELFLTLKHKDEDIKYENETIEYITKHFKNLKLLKLDMGRIENFEIYHKTKTVSLKKTGEKWKKETSSLRPFALDLNQFTSLTKLERIDFSQHGDEIGFKVINPVSITKLKNITNIHINDEKFTSEDLITIRNITEVPRDKFLEECKKKDKSIINEYGLSVKDKKKYDSLDRAISFGGYIEEQWSGNNIEEILKQRKVKIKNVN